MANFQRGKPCFKKDVEAIKAMESALAPVDRILLRTFRAMQLKSGYLIQQLCISATVDEIQNFA